MIEKKIPSCVKKILLISLLIVFPLTVSAKTKTVRYGDATWTLYTSPNKYFLVLGPWGDKAVYIDRPVDNMWGAAGSAGLSIVYQKGIEFRWQILQGDTGDEIVGGALFYMGPETGYVKWISLSSAVSGAIVKVVFDTGKFIDYQLDIHGHKTIIREGEFKNS